MKNTLYSFLAFLFVLAFCSCDKNNTSNKDTTGNNGSEVVVVNPKIKISLPLGGNVYSSKPLSTNKTITDNGIENWSDSKEFFTAYFRISQAGTFQINIEELGQVYGNSELEFSINGESKRVRFDSNTKKDIVIGSWKIDQEGYVAVKITGISKTGNLFPSIKSLSISSDFDGNFSYVPNNEGSFFHWGRRGPSVHLSYQVPTNKDVEWYYNEVTIPDNEDKVGSYFMANGFAEGYFGIQVNSTTERRILFSVWSPYTTDDPNSIPESHKVRLLRKGEGVYTGEFGNEGSGGQSYLKYNWKTGNTYKFLLSGIPQGNNTTTYTAYFYAPELNKWILIASFNRPETNTYLKKFYSFVENFNPDQGALSRKALFNNQWVRDNSEAWTEISSAQFTIDATGKKGYRMDYAGGVENGTFYLKNGGFFDNYTTPQTLFTRPLGHNTPQINFNSLP